jgi:acyl-CoA dehydrogenase
LKLEELTPPSPLLESAHHALALRARAAFAAFEPHGAWDEQALVAQLAAAGFYPYLVPSAFGGANERVDVRSLCVLREELAYRSPAADSVFAVQGLGSHPVLLAGSAEQKAQLLPAVAKGAALFAFALTEPEAGSDVAAIQTTATREGDFWVLKGHKRFISNAGVATHHTVFARTGEGSKGISCFVVPASTAGQKVVPMELMGEHPIGELFFDGCRVPDSARVGTLGQGLKLALGTLDVFRSTVGAAAVGMARRALDEALVWTRGRVQFGKPLSELAAVQALLADSTVELDASRLLVHRAALAKDQGQERITYEAAVGKLFATEAAQRIIDRCLQVHGGQGVVKGTAVERLYRDVRALRIYEGASEVQRLVIARHLLRDS